MSKEKNQLELWSALSSEAQQIAYFLAKLNNANRNTYPIDMLASPGSSLNLTAEKIASALEELEAIEFIQFLLFLEILYEQATQYPLIKADTNPKTLTDDEFLARKALQQISLYNSSSEGRETWALPLYIRLNQSHVDFVKQQHA